MATALGPLVLGAVGIAVVATSSKRQRKRRREAAYRQQASLRPPVFMHSQPQQGPALYYQPQQTPEVVVTQRQLQALAPELGVASVSLTGFQTVRGTTWYTVQVYPENGGPTWKVMRRYSQFRDMRKKMGRVATRLPNAPFPKRDFGIRVFDKRQRLLEQWLSSAIQHARKYTAWRTHLRDFLGEAPRASPARLQNYAVPMAATAVSAPLQGLPNLAFAVAPPVPASQAASAPVPLPPPVESTMMMEIEVPAGVCAGQLIGVEVPSGQQLMLTVPNGYMAGQLLRLQYDPVAPSIQPLL